MITLPSQVEVQVYISVDGSIVVSHEDQEHGVDAHLVMTKARAVELAKAIRKVASEVWENGES